MIGFSTPMAVPRPRYGLLPLLFVFFLGIANGSKAQSLIPLVDDNFTSDTNYYDLTKIMLWGQNTVPTSGFERILKSDKSGLQYMAITPSDSMRKYGTSYTAVNSLRTASAIDYRFPTVDRLRDTLTLEFDVYWDTLMANGESNRIVAAFLHDYPAQFPPFGTTDSVQAEAPFGRPAYNFRVLGRHPSNNWKSFFLFYGGGKVPLGEMEKTNDWWLPGFIAEPGGNAPGSGGDYPRSPTISTRLQYASSQYWTRFRLRLFQNRADLMYKRSGTPDNTYQMMGFMHLPNVDSVTTSQAITQLNQAHGSNITTLPMYYRWFNHISALRLYFRCGGPTYMANVQVKSTGRSVTAARPLARLNVRVYPNPVTEALFVDLATPAQAQLIGMDGKVYATGIVGRNQPLDVRHVPPGMYLLRAQSGQTQFTARIVK